MVVGGKRLVLPGLLVVSSMAFTAAMSACVGDDPGTSSEQNDSGSGGDGATTDTGGGTDSGNGGDTGGSTDAGSDGAGGDADADAAPPRPDNVQASALQLWLTADKGVSCDTGVSPNRVTSWTDQSSHGRNAMTPGTGKGPRCNTVTFNSIGVLEFTKPTVASAPYDVETLNVDLSFLVANAYTIFVVEKAVAVGNGNRAGILGTQLPGDPSDPFSSANKNKGIHLGYEPSPDHLSFDQDYSGCGSHNVTLPATAPSVTVAWFDSTVGHKLYRNGMAYDAVLANKDAMIVATNGAIGRSFFASAADSRYSGSIAEVIIYNAALSDIDRAAIESYTKTHWALSFM